MIELPITREYLKIFFDNLRYEDKLELDKMCLDFSLDEFFKIITSKNSITYFIADLNLNPIAIGGVVKENASRAKIWLLCSKNILFYKKSFLKYISLKLKYFKSNYSYLYNYIYRSNFPILNWLKGFGFKWIDLNNPDYKYFYFKRKEE